MSSRIRQTNATAASTNKTLRNSGSFSADKQAGTIKGTGISFGASSTIFDSNNGLGIFPIGTRIMVQGSPLNSRRWTVTGITGPGQIAVRPQMVQTEAAGPTITITTED